MIDTSLTWLLDEPLDAEERAWDHAMDVSASVHHRMSELGITNKELAQRLGVTPGRVSQILKGDENLTLKTLARLEDAVGFDLSQGFRYYLGGSSPSTRRCFSFVPPVTTRWGSAGESRAKDATYAERGTASQPRKRLELVA